MLVKIKSIEDINKYRKNNDYPSPGFITEDNYLCHYINKHSMEYYCGKIIKLDEDNNFGGWSWADWMLEKISTSLDIE